ARWRRVRWRREHGRQHHAGPVGRFGGLRSGRAALRDRGVRGRRGHGSGSAADAGVVDAIPLTNRGYSRSRGGGGGADTGLRPSRRASALLQVAGSVDAELLELVAQGAEGDAERGRGLGLVVLAFLKRLLDGGAFDLFDVRGQRA